MKRCLKISLISIFFSFFSGFQSRFYHIHCSLNTATDDVTNYVTHSLSRFNTKLSYSCADFILKIDEKNSLADGF